MLSLASLAKSVGRGTALSLFVTAGSLLAGPALAADPQPYEVSVKKTGNSAIDAAVAASSTLVSLQKTKAVGPFALSGRIRSDYERVQTALESFGYYAAKVIITLDSGAGWNKAGDDPELPDFLDRLPPGKTVKIHISTVLGPRFHLGKVALVPKDEPPPLTLTPAQQKAFNLKSGQPAVASDVIAAKSNLLNALYEDSHAMASVDEPVAYLKPQQQSLDVEFAVHKGPFVNLGPIRFSGLKKVNESYLRRRLLLKPGEAYKPSKIETARQDLAGLGVFSDVRVEQGKQLLPDGSLPLTIYVQEAKRHAVSFDAGYSTDLGGLGGVKWTHFNLFGNAERLQLVAMGTGLVGTATKGLGYDVYADFLKPDLWHRDQDLTARAEMVNQDLYSYHQKAVIARVGLTRKISKRWSFSGSLAAEEESINQQGYKNDYTLFFIPLNAHFDNTDAASALSPATRGMRADISVTPVGSFGNGSEFFTILQGSGSTYFDLSRVGISDPGRSVLAFRGTLGVIKGASTFSLPPDQRLYGGGSATIRGFRFQGVGPQFPNSKYAMGGTSLDAGTVEYRQRLFKDFGAVAFVDAGQVGSNARPFDGKLRVGTGVGARYYTAIGPIRVDVAVPVNRPHKGDKFELYIGLGETF